MENLYFCTCERQTSFLGNLEKRKKIFNFSQPGLENIHKNLNDNVTIEIINMKWHFNSVTFYQKSS